MSATTLTEEAQLFAEAQMVDGCTITVPSDAEPTYDPDSFEAIPAPPTTLYAGPCQVSARQGAGAQDGTVQAGDRLIYEQTRTVKVPMAVTGVPVGATVTITASLDQDLVDRAFLVRGFEHKTYLTARRLVCEEVTA